MEGRRFVLLIALTVLVIAVITFSLYLLTRQDEDETRERLQSPVAVLALSGERYL
jgi:hypothetical protein